MSFILDALKKSDKKRQEVGVPRLDSVLETGEIKSHRRSVWMLLLLVVLLLNAALLLWFLLSRPAPPAVGEAPLQTQQAETEIAPRITVTRPSPPVEPQTRISSSEKLPEPATVPMEPTLVDDNRVYLLSELPRSVQRRIPPMHMSLHAYSKAGGTSRLVRINDQMLREGSKLDEMFLLERISADGAVFRFEGYQFLVPRRGASEH